MNKLSLIKNGIIKENPTLVLLLGTCPTLAVSTSVVNGIGMGLAAMAVLTCSNIFISLLKSVIPDKVRIPCYIVLIAGFTTIVSLLLQAFAPELNKSLGLFIPLIVVNCIILGRAEMFANKNTVIDSALDGIGMGIGFTFALACMGAVRELLGSGTLLGINILAGHIEPMGIFNLAPGGFFTFAVIMALVAYLTKDKSKIKKDFGCGGCAMESTCGGERKELEKLVEKKGEEAC